MHALDALNTLDWIILTLLLWSVFNGVWHGFSQELFGLIGLIAAFLITTFAGKLLDGPLAGLLPDTAMGRMFGRAIVFLGCILIINILAGALAAGLRSVLSQVVDRTLGLIFGFIRGSLIVLLPFLLVNLYIDPKVYPDWLTEARSYPYLDAGAQHLRAVIPESEINDRERTDFSEFKKAAQEQEEKLTAATHPNGKKGEKNKKAQEKDSAGNIDWKELFESVKDILFH